MFRPLSSKKLVSMMIGLGLLLGMTAFAQEQKTTKKKKGGKKKKNQKKQEKPA